jgi:2-hydroxychromene-2-carboxylate isomerase
MAKNVEFFFDVVSPTAYVAHKRLPAIAAATGATVRYRPMLLGGVMKATGNAPPFSVPAKGAYFGVDLNRYIQKHAVPFTMNPHFPINSLSLMRAAAGLEGAPHFAEFVDAMFDAMWLEPRNMGDAATAAAAMREAGLDADAILAVAESQEAKDRLKATTEEAVSRGAFGAPTFFVGDEMFFGQDRLDWVEEALR